MTADDAKRLFSPHKPRGEGSLGTFQHDLFVRRMMDALPPPLYTPGFVFHGPDITVVGNNRTWGSGPPESGDMA